MLKYFHEYKRFSWSSDEPSINLIILEIVVAPWEQSFY